MDEDAIAHASEDESDDECCVLQIAYERDIEQLQQVVNAFAQRIEVLTQTADRRKQLLLAQESDLAQMHVRMHRFASALARQQRMIAVVCVVVAVVAACYTRVAHATPPSPPPSPQ